MHPAMVNGLTCGQNGEAAAAELFGDMPAAFLWAPVIKPGYTLSKVCSDLFAKHSETYGNAPSILILQNHGVFVAADTTNEAGQLMTGVVSRIGERIVRRPEFDGAGDPKAGAADAAKKLEALYPGTAVFLYNKEIARLTESKEAYVPVMKSFTPDHTIYCGANPLFADSPEELESGFAEYEESYGIKPKVVAIRGLGVFALGSGPAEAERTATVYMDVIKVVVFSESFGGPMSLSDDFTDFIVNWESESYRLKKV